MIEIQGAKVNRIIEGYVIKSNFDQLEPALKKQVTEVPHPRLLLIMQKFSGGQNAGTFLERLTDRF